MGVAVTKLDYKGALAATLTSIIMVKRLVAEANSAA